MMAIAELMSNGRLAGREDARFVPPPQTVRRFLLALVRMLFRVGFRVELRDAQRLPRSPYVLVFNHTSLLDLLALHSALPPRAAAQLLTPAADDYFFRSRWLATLTRWFMNGFPFDRKVRPQESLRRCLGELAAGRSLAIAPEGTRSRDGRLQPFRTGFAVLALAQQVPIVPAYIDGAHRALPKGRWFPRPTKIRIQLGTPLQPERVDHLTDSRSYLRVIQQVSSRARASIEELRDGLPCCGRQARTRKVTGWGGVSAAAALQRALSVLACPLCKAAALAQQAQGDRGVLRCGSCGGEFPWRDGIVDLRDRRTTLRPPQRFFNFPLVARVYDRWWGPAFWKIVCGLRGPSEGELLEQALQGLPNGGAGALIGDFACGTGNYTRMLADRFGPDAVIVAMDLSMPMLRQARAALAEHPQVVFVCADLEHLPIRRASLPMAFCWAAVHLLPHPDRFLQQAHASLVPGGRLDMMTLATDGTAYGHALLRVLDVTGTSGSFHREELGATLIRVGFERVTLRQPSRALLVSAQSPLVTAAAGA